MKSGLTTDAASPSTLVFPLAAKNDRVSREILRELDASLRASQKALLSGDLAGIEQGTREQEHLRRALEALWTARPHGFTEDRALLEQVLHLGRVQVALLSRAQRSLRITSRVLAGPGADYAPSTITDATGVFESRGETRLSPCRA
jgi:hypothetical protein